MEIDDELTERIERLETRGFVLVHADERPSAQHFGEAPFRFEGPTFRNSTPSAVGMTLEKAVAQAETKADFIESEKAVIATNDGHLSTNI
jgi:hypothetical protein